MAESTQSTLEVSSLDHVVLYCRDTAASRDFYTSILGMTAGAESEAYVFLSCGAQTVALFRADGRAAATGPGPPTQRRELDHLAFNVNSGYDDTLARLRQRGIEVETRAGDPRCIYILDPDGHRIQILARTGAA